MKLFISLLVFGWIIYAANNEPVTNPPQSLEYKLAVLNGQELVSESDPVIQQFGDLLDSLVANTITPRERIGDMTVFMQQKLKDQGKNFSILEIMIQANIAATGIDAKMDYAQLVTLVGMLMANGV